MSTPMKPEEKAWIDNANYIQLLRKWRFTVTPPGESIFSGESGLIKALWRPKMCPKKRGKKHGEEEKKKMTKEDHLELRILFLTKTENRSWRRSGRR